MAERILLVEDEEKLARMVEMELRYEGYQVEEIGIILGRKPSTVRCQLTRGRALLRSQLEGENHYE